VTDLSTERLLVAGTLLLLGGCALFSPIPDLRSPADRAREIEPKCRDLTQDPAIGTPYARDVDSVEAAYVHVQSGPSDREARLRGARIHVRPLPGLTRESLQRTLECHEARVTLRGADGEDTDPYVLPGRWLDIDVASEGDGFVVAVQVDGFDDARRVLDRARRFSHESSKLR
jgi:hypothetical protein